MFHQTAVLWTEKSLDMFDPAVKVKGIPGDPRVWVESGQIPAYSETSPSDPNVKAVSHRIALGFRYNAKELYFSDRGLKELYKIVLHDPEGTTPAEYQVSVERVYHGTSTVVNGMAVDWVSGCIYWTDGLYNWISVASVSDPAIFRHIVTTGLDGPTGIAVHPKLGKLYWGELTGVAKIEWADLDGSNRRTFITEGVETPIGVTIDYREGRIYWVDDLKDTIESANVNTGLERQTIQVQNGANKRTNYVFGIAVNQDYIFITDQFDFSVKVWNKTTSKMVYRHGMFLTRPYDIMVYDSSLQEEINSDCNTLGCEHMCISTGNGGGKCMCSQGWTLNEDGVTCKNDGALSKPRYIYTVGNELCTTPINYPDRKEPKNANDTDVQCFLGSLTHAEALAVDVDAELLFYSDTKERTISRVHLGDAKLPVTKISVQRGKVRGLAVDWLTSNLYWTDEESGHIMMSRLDGKYPHVLVTGLTEPRGIVVHPAKGMMYWSTPSAIYRAHMDGSEMNILWDQNNTAPDGIFLDYRDDRLYWGDANLPGIRSILTNGSGFETVVQALDHMVFRDLTAYEDYMAWTNGTNGVVYAKRPRVNGKRKFEILKSVQHPLSEVSHDIVTYGDFSQPPGSNLCSDDNGGCSHLCVPRGTGRVCKCAIGFYLDSRDDRTCMSDLKDIEVLLFIDPYHRQMYELDMEKETPTPQGIPLSLSVYPDQYAYDPVGKDLYWYDKGASAIKTQPLDYYNREQVISILPENWLIGGMDIHESSKQLFYADGASNTIYSLSLTRKTVSEFVSGQLVPDVIAVDNVNDRLIWGEHAQKDGVVLYVRPITETAEEKLVFFVVGDRAITGITIDPRGQFLYRWSMNEVHRIKLSGETTDGDYMIRRGAFNVDLQSVGVYDHTLYYSEKGSTALYKYNMETKRGGIVTDHLFSKIQNIKVYRTISRSSTKTPNKPSSGESNNKPNQVEPPFAETRQPTTSEKAGGLSPTNIAIIAGASAGVVLLLGLILTAVCLCGRKRNKKLPPSKESMGAHDNPTYMTSGQVARGAAPAAAATGAQGAVGGQAPRSLPEGVYDELPAGKAEGEYDTYLPPQQRLEEDARALGFNANSPGTDVDSIDQAKLVDNMADSNEVVLTVDGEEQGPTATFKKGNEAV